jgi:hypothetical protein
MKRTIMMMAMLALASTAMAHNGEHDYVAPKTDAASQQSAPAAQGSVANDGQAIPFRSGH